MANETPQLQWIKAPLQERSERTLEALLDAAEVLLESETLQGASVSAIARAAGSSVGAFYHRFPDKQALARTLYERFRHQSLATVQENFSPERWKGHDLAQLLNALIAFTAHDYLERPGLRRFALNLVQSDADIRTLSKELAGSVVDSFEQLLVSRRSEFSHPDPRLAAEFLHRMMFATLDQVAIFYGEAPTGNELSEAALVEELSSAIRAYLGVHAATN